MTIAAACTPFLSELAPDAIPAAAFAVENVHYAWSRGVVEPVT